MGARLRLVLVSPDARDPLRLARLAELVGELAPVVDALILRWSGPDAGTMVAAARALRANAPGLPLLLRDRFDVARAAGLSGVQLPEDGVDPAEVRELWPEALVGVSRHDASGLERRVAGADFALVSPVFPTASKPGHPGIGIGALTRLVRACAVPVVALGGIDAARVAEVLSTGASGVAVRSTVFDAVDPVRAARELREAVDSAG